MTKEVAKIDDAKLLQPQNSAENLISQAINKKVSVETIEKLLAMRQELKKEWAKEQFILAMSKFQSECPIIKKDKIVKDKSGKARYGYAPLESIVSQVKIALTNNCLSYKFDENKDDKFTTAICVVTHINGHSEQSSFKVEIGNEEYMTSVQKYGARMTFAKRYAFCNALGILTGDEDNDGNDIDLEQKNKKKVDIEVQGFAEEVGSLQKNNVVYEEVNSSAPQKKCPICNKFHTGKYPKCFDCWKSKATPTKTLINEEAPPFENDAPDFLAD